MSLKTTLMLSYTIATILCLWGGSLQAQENPEAIIEEKCAADWPDNYRMRAACIEQQGKVLNKSLSSPTDPRLALEDRTLMRENCAKKWPDDFRMRAKCEQQQIEGFQKLQSPPPKDVTLKDYSVAVAHCAREWPDDFRMRARCLEEQLAAVRMHHDLRNMGVELK